MKHPKRRRTRPVGDPRLPPGTAAERQAGPDEGAGRLLGIGRADWTCIGVLLLATLAFFWKGLVDPVGMVREDAAYLSQPYYQYAADEVRNGRFPHWNPYAACGMPYHATLQGAVLYPLRWPMFWMSYHTGYALGLWVHYFLTGAFTFLFIRMTLRCDPLPALLGAVSFEFCGFMMGHLTHWNYFQAYPWFVLAVFLLSQAIRRSSWIWAVAAAVPVGLIGLIGAVHILLVLGFGLVLWAAAETVLGVVRRVRGKDIAWVRVFWPAIAVGIALILGAAIGAGQLWPAQVQTKLSTRTATTWEFITEICADPVRSFVRLIAPFYWGNYQLGYWGENSWHEQSFYLGIIPLIAAVVAIATRIRDGWVLRLLGLCVVAGVVAAGKYLPVFRLLYEYVPLFDRLRDPARVFLWVEFGIACLAAIGMQRLAQADGTRLPRSAVIAAAIAALVCVAVIVGSLMSLNQMTDDPSAAAANVRGLELKQEEVPAHVKEAMAVAGRIVREKDAAAWLGVLAGIVSCAMIAAMVLARRRLTLLWGGALVGLAALDLGMFSAGSLQYSRYDALVVKRPEYVKFLQERLGLERYMCWRGPEDATNRHRGMLWRIRHAMSGPGGIFHTPHQAQFNGLVFSGRYPRLLHLAGVRYLVMNEPPEGQGVKTTLRDGSVSVIENSQAMPRAFLARQMAVAEDPNRILAEMAVGSSDLLDVALLEEAIDPLPPGGGPRDPNEGVNVEQAEPSRFAMRTRASGPRQLVLTETYNPEWECKIDGQMTRVYRTDYTFMSVRVPAGEHEVRWQYEPAAFRRGLAVTVTACALVTGAFGACWFLRRRTRKGMVAEVTTPRGGAEA